MHDKHVFAQSSRAASRQAFVIIGGIVNLQSRTPCTADLFKSLEARFLAVLDVLLEAQSYLQVGHDDAST